MARLSRGGAEKLELRFSEATKNVDDTGAGVRIHDENSSGVWRKIPNEEKGNKGNRIYDELEREREEEGKRTTASVAVRGSQDEEDKRTYDYVFRAPQRPSYIEREIIDRFRDIERYKRGVIILNRAAKYVLGYLWDYNITIHKNYSGNPLILTLKVDFSVRKRAEEEELAPEIEKIAKSEREPGGKLVIRAGEVLAPGVTNPLRDQ